MYQKFLKKLKKVHLVLTYQRNGQVKFRDFGLKYTSDPEDSKIKQTHVLNILNPLRKNQKGQRDTPSLVCAEVGSNENTVTIRYGPFEIANVNPEEEIKKQF